MSSEGQSNVHDTIRLSVVYPQVDFPDVVRRKVSMIREQKKLSDMLEDGLEDKHRSMYLFTVCTVCGMYICILRLYQTNTHIFKC